MIYKITIFCLRALDRALLTSQPLLCLKGRECRSISEKFPGPVYSELPEKDKRGQ